MLADGFVSLNLICKIMYKLQGPVNKRVGKAMHDYGMISDGDKILVAVSGGVDSLVLAWLLYQWRKKAPISYRLLFIHINSGFSPLAADGEYEVAVQLKQFGITVEVIEGRAIEGERNCFICSKQRRNQLFDLADERGCSKIAFGHHKDDLIETLFINMLYSGNISTMLPKQALFDNTLHLIRPMAYLEKSEVVEIAEGVGLRPTANLCPLADNTRRDKIRTFLEQLYKEDPEVKNSIFASLSNVREGYML